MQDGPITVPGREGRAAESADERVTRTRGQTEQPGDQVPDNRAEQRAEYRRHGDDFQVDDAFADGGGDRRAHERAGHFHISTLR